MSREQLSIAELLPSLDSSELQEAEQVRAAVNQHLSTDKGGAVLSCLVDYYLDSSSSQAVLLLSSIREPHHKALLEKLNESLSRPGSRLGAVTLLGHLIRKQPPWVHHISHSPLLSSLLRCLKTDTDVVLLITGVLVLITLLPMIPQAGKQHIYDFFDVFGRLASWSYKNIGHLPVVQLVHLHAGVYSLFHRLYGMFPCNFIYYLRLHYSMKENLDTFQEVVKPMLEHVRVHPELVTGTQDYELDPSRWRRYEVHDIIIECSRVSLDPLESSCEEDMNSWSSTSLRPPPVCSPLPHLDFSSCSPFTVAVSSSEVSASLSGRPLPHALSSSCTQLDDLTWSPSSHCGLSTPPPDPAGLTPSLSRTASVSGVKCPTAVAVPLTPTNGDSQQLDSSSQVKQPIIVEQEAGSSDVINRDFKPAETRLPSTTPSTPSQPLTLTSTPSRDESSPTLSQPACSFPLFLTPPPLCSRTCNPGVVSLLSSTHSTDCPAPPYESLFELTLPQVAKQFIRKKTEKALQSATGEQENDREEETVSISPLKALDQMIMYGSEAHESLSRRWAAGNKLVDRSNYGGKQQSMKTKGPASGEESQSLRSQLLLVHSQLQYERFKRQQHAIRNRRLLRRVINTTVLEEHSVAMKAQLGVQDEEIRSLKSSLGEEQRRNADLQQEMRMQTDRLQAQVQQQLQRQQEEQRENHRLQGELQESQSKLRNLEAELQSASNEAYNAEHQLTQLSLKLCSSEQLQQQIFLLNQQLLLLRETNRALSQQLEDRGARNWTEVSMLQCSAGKEFQRLKDSDIQQRQKLEAANHRIAELENQLSKKEQLILDQKKLMEDTKNQSRMELLASESRCEGLRRVTQALQMEMLHLYGLIHLEPHGGCDTQRPNSSSSRSSVPQASSSSAVSIINGAVEALSTSPLHLPSCSSSPPLSLSPIDSPLTVGSFLEQRARELFRPANQGQEEEEKEADEEEEEAQLASPPLGQEAEEATPLTEGPQEEPAAPDSTLAAPQRRLGIMDYDQSLPEF
ncbi:hamartin isoform X1 [Oryzias latipes]|uniref:hamartin isoform X1 n=1 Tax=Oryzias latipes TaxID=8090 RepID=UPI0002A4A5DA|nr:hamartin isoform X1 [Oryzias latipes]XP_011477894.1 hamartin isoform X1 [Oryzias latipes]